MENTQAALDNKKKLRDMMAGKIDTESLDFIKKMNKIDKVADSKSPVKKTTQNNNSRRNYDEDEREVDFLAEAEKKLKRARELGVDSFIMENSAIDQQSKPFVNDDAIALMLAGKGGLKEAKKLQNQLVQKEVIKENKYTQEDEGDILNYYKKPVMMNEQREEPIYQQHKQNNTDYRSLIKEEITNMLFEEALNGKDGKLTRLISNILKEQIKPALKEVLLEMKGMKK